MKRNLIRLGGMAVLAAGMAIAQTSAPAPASPPAQSSQSATPAKPGIGEHDYRGQLSQRMMDQLNLTPDQRAKAKVIFDKARQSAQSYTQQLRTNREAMAAAVKANDSAKIRQLASERGRLTGEVTAIRSEASAKFYSSLTPAQRAKADQIHQQRQQRMQERRTAEKTNG
jgi:Spy/CpxP family protein refolding chaperone